MDPIERIESSHGKAPRLENRETWGTPYSLVDGSIMGGSRNGPPALAGEPIGVVTVAAMIIILLGVALVNAGQKEEHVPAGTNGNAECEEEEAVA
jgi:hypothetical protein